MGKNPKYLSLIFCGVITTMLVTSQVGRAAPGVIGDASTASSGPARLSVSKENIHPMRQPRYPEAKKVSPKTSTSDTLVSPATVLSMGSEAFSGPPGDVTEWILTFSDEFDAESLNPDKWATEYGLDTYCIVDNPPPPGEPSYCNRSNNDEKEWYIDASPTVEGGVLKLTASINDCSGDGLPDRSYAPYSCANFPYLSGMVSTHDRFSQLYGYFEARIKLVNGQGFWPAFWMIPQLPAVPNPAVEYFWPPEIDILEYKGQEPNTIFMNHHFSGVYPEPGSKLNNWSYGGRVGSNYSGPDYSADFHTYAMEWQPGLIIWYIDGIEQFRSTYLTPPGTINPPDYSGEMLIILNLAVGGGFVDHLLPPDELLPATMEVDYVRVYQNISLPLAEFSSNTPLELGETAIFTNSSTGSEPLSFRWDFGDTFTSTLPNPMHIFAAAGTYTVTLTATNNGGSDTVSHEFVVWTINTSIYIPWLTKH
jgi:beta-glucanase (GH16 family)